MRNRPFLTVLLAAAIPSLLAAAPAEATTFCVPNFHAACPNNGTNVAAAALDTAITANGTDGTPDTVLIAPGTQIDTESFEATGSDPLLIQGAGPAQTF